MAKQDPAKVISAKDLGQLALADFCPRCFWLERNMGKPPSIFPGIFSTLDSLSKRSVVRSFLDRNRQPDWLPIQNVHKHVDPAKLSVPVTEYDWILTGVPDDVFLLSDGSYHVVDYKTAKFTPTQDSLFPMYEVQLNAYAFAAPHHRINPVSKLSLIYCEPEEDLDADSEFRLTFGTHLSEISLRPQMIPPLLEKARIILQNKSLPEARIGCKKICAWVRKLSEEQG